MGIMKDVKYKNEDVEAVRFQLEQLEYHVERNPLRKQQIGNLIEQMMPHIKENLDNLDEKYVDKSQSE